MQCAVPPGTQSDGILSDNLWVEMKQAAGKISRSHFEIYATPGRHSPGPQPGPAGPQGPAATAGASWARSIRVVIFFGWNPRSGSPLLVLENKSRVTVRVSGRLLPASGP